MQVRLDQLASCRTSGSPRGITSVCSAHSLVLRAALRQGVATGTSVLLEATCNQVNHLGGYTGMQPADFASLVNTLADDEGYPREQVILGGDHLGPNPWRSQPAEPAMDAACRMVEAYVAAGFRKLHLDASMGCSGEPAALDDVTTARRAVRLAAVAERAAAMRAGAMPCYIIGTEVPPPGGADHRLDDVTPTAAAAARQTIEVHREIFAEAGLSEAFERVIGIVVQPGVEFGNRNVIRYRRDKADTLIHVLDEHPRLVFEAHSTDYQGTDSLTELVEDGFAILKVGPELSFVLREALYALDMIASDLLADYGERPLRQTMEEIMVASPDHWHGHYSGDATTTGLLRHYSLSDRIRYYWATDAAKAAVNRLRRALSGQHIPLPLLWQHLPEAAHFADQALAIDEVLIWRITRSLASYQAACRTSEP